MRGDAAVERIEQDGKAYGFGRRFELVEAAMSEATHA